MTTFHSDGKDSDVLKEQAVRNAVMRYFAGYAHPPINLLVEEVQQATSLPEAVITQVINRLIIEEQLELRRYRSPDGTWNTVIDLTPPSKRYPKILDK